MATAREHGARLVVSRRFPSFSKPLQDLCTLAVDWSGHDGVPSRIPVRHGSHARPWPSLQQRQLDWLRGSL